MMGEVNCDSDNHRGAYGCSLAKGYWQNMRLSLRLGAGANEKVSVGRELD